MGTVLFFVWSGEPLWGTRRVHGGGRGRGVAIDLVMARTGVSVVVGRHGGGRTRATRDTVGGVPGATVEQWDIVVVECGKVGVTAKPPHKRCKHKQYKQGLTEWSKQVSGVNRGGTKVAGPLGCKWARLGK